MEFTFKNSDALELTGFSGWLNTDTRTVIFCSRLAHFDLITQSGRLGYDGKPLGIGLDGIDGERVHDLPSEGGPRGSGWAEVRQWCAEKGWVHFVTNDEITYVTFVCASVAQEKVCKEFAREAGIPAIFKYTSYYKD